jgi:hypothetical protein
MMKLMLTAVLLFLLTACHNQLRLVKVRDHHSKQSEYRVADSGDEVRETLFPREDTVDISTREEIDFIELKSSKKEYINEFNVEIASFYTVSTITSENSPRSTLETDFLPRSQPENKLQRNEKKTSYFSFDDICFFGMIFSLYAAGISVPIVLVFVIWGLVRWFWLLIVPVGFLVLSFLLVVLYFASGGGII